MNKGGVATGVRQGEAAHFNFQTKQGPTVSVSNIRDIAFYGCSEIIRTRNFKIFTVYATIFGHLMAVFYFFYFLGEIDYFTLGHLKMSNT